METIGFKTIDIKNKKGFQAIRIPKKMQVDDDKVYLKKVWDDSAKVIFKGIGNGIYMEYFFQRDDNNKWKLTKWSNLSN